MYGTLARNVLFNWTGFFVHALVAFFLTPYVVERLGSTRFGIWALVSGITGYYGLLDLGFRSGIQQYMTRYLANRDFDRFNRTTSTAFVGLIGIGAIIASITIIVAYVAAPLFSVKAELVRETQCCILIIGLSVASQFCLSPFGAVFVAAQRYDLSNIIGISVRLATAGTTLLVLRMGGGLIELSLVIGGLELIGSLVRTFVAFRIIPDLVISPRLAQLDGLRPIMTFSLWYVLIEGGNRVIYSSDAIVIGFFLPVAAIAPFALAVSLTEYFARLFQPIGRVFYPAATQLDAQGALDRIRDIYLGMTRVLLLLAIAAGLFSFSWADDFYRLWLGDRLEDSVAYGSSANLYRTLVIGSIFFASQRVGYQVLMGMRLQKQLCYLVVGEALMNLTISIGLIRPLGLIGVALGTTIPAVIFQGALVPRTVMRALKIPLTTYIRSVWLRPTVVALMSTMVIGMVRYLMPPAIDWRQLLSNAFAAGLPILILIVAIGLNGRERDRFVFRPLSRLAGRSSRSYQSSTDM